MEENILALEVHWNSKSCLIKEWAFCHVNHEVLVFLELQEICAMIYISISSVPDATPVGEKPPTLPTALRYKGKPFERVNYKVNV